MFKQFKTIVLHIKTEKARILREAKAAEDARKRAEAEAEADAKRKRELEREAAREAARQALLEVWFLQHCV